MKNFHLSCGTMNVFGFPREDGSGGFFKRGCGVIHCLLIETDEGLSLVYAWWGVQDCIHPSLAVKQFMALTHCSANSEETTLSQITKQGYSRSDLKHIFLTHMHMDHAGGLFDFPAATIHVFDSEIESWLHPRTLMERRAYQPASLVCNPHWEIHQLLGDQWCGFDCLAPVRVGEATLVMIPFTGHTSGHCCVAVDLGKKMDTALWRCIWIIPAGQPHSTLLASLRKIDGNDGEGTFQDAKAL